MATPVRAIGVLTAAARHVSRSGRMVWCSKGAMGMPAVSFQQRGMADVFQRNKVSLPPPSVHPSIFPARGSRGSRCEGQHVGPSRIIC
eukprot:2044641-Rhodomonas_salina.4